MMSANSTAQRTLQGLSLRHTIGCFVAALLFTGTAQAQFTDDFNRADEILDASANWTAVTGGRDRLEVDNNRVESNGTESTAEVYLAPDQGSADMYAQADWLGDTDTTEILAVRAVDLANLVGIAPGASNTVRCMKRVSAVETNFGTVSNAGVTGFRIETEGTTVRCYVDTGSGFTTPFHTEANVTDLATATRAGLRSTASLGQDGVALWDNYETGSLSAPPSTTVQRRRRMMMQD